jgi:hypothetical protein
VHLATDSSGLPALSSYCLAGALAQHAATAKVRLADNAGMIDVGGRGEAGHPVTCRSSPE